MEWQISKKARSKFVDGMVKVIYELIFRPEISHGCIYTLKQWGLGNHSHKFHKTTQFQTQWEGNKISLLL